MFEKENSFENPSLKESYLKLCRINSEKPLDVKNSNAEQVKIQIGMHIGLVRDFVDQLERLL